MHVNDVRVLVTYLLWNRFEILIETISWYLVFVCKQSQK